MTERSCTRSNPSSRSCADAAAGYSLVELLVAMAVVLSLAAAAMQIAQSSRVLYDTDQARTTLAQNLRIGVDMLAIDVREAGERLPTDVPALEIIDGGGGSDTLILRRSMLDAVLPLCVSINAGSSTDRVFVAKNNAHPPPGCSPAGDTDSDGWPDNLEEWRNYRIANGGTVLVYLYDPLSHLGEFFNYDAEDNSNFHIHRANGTWANDFPVAHGSRLYVLEQRTYRVQNGVLQLFINASTTPYNLVSHITSLEAKALMNDGTTRTSLGPSNDWSTLSAVETRLSGSATYRNAEVARSLSTRLFPRNVLSR